MDELKKINVLARYIIINVIMLLPLLMVHFDGIHDDVSVNTRTVKGSDKCLKVVKFIWLSYPHFQALKCYSFI